MFRATFAAVTVVAFVCMAPLTSASSIEVTLSSPDDLTHLILGEQVTIDVNLQGVPLPLGQDFIFVLNTKVLFPSAQFEAIADPNNSSGLTPAFSPGLASQYSNFNALSSLNATDATGRFSDSSPNLSAPINDNGLYYSFTLKAIATGIGSILFDSTPDANRYAASDTGFNFAPLPTGEPLLFAVSTVPEPSTLTLGLVGSLISLGYFWSRGRSTVSAGRTEA